ncbi:alpha/beta fold hydrolase [Streptomyces qinzhouensis]|uniref:Alpha/beta hydrolase n=1 Tax=Streptomyces qinzhouensis TaxID=2599401 RepID=A0A5B8ILK1_9ACTN|nr:alpha/beta hydrolase [Streptomyces qinzhouensis]QDY79438.1 alpha/beta hydrolase [Streptomyces qinzhouensis]
MPETSGTSGADGTEWDDGLRYADLGGTSLAYREAGSGEPVVLVHGDLSDLRTWAAQMDPFAERYRVLAYSRRYARPNPDIPPGVPNPMQPHVDDLVAFLRATGAAPAHLVANSWGAFISLLTAIRHPDAVRSLVLEEPPVVPVYLSDPPRPAQLLRLVLRPRTLAALLTFQHGTVKPVGRAFAAGDDDRGMKIFLRGVIKERALRRLPRERRTQSVENLSALKAGLFDAGFPPLDPDEVRGVRAPVLLVTGEDSTAVLPLLSERLAELLPRAEQIRIPGASHLMHEENPPVLNRAVLDFLARHGGRPPG